jgi:hypothetical protein
VHYGGEVVVHRGATYQALCDTARAPPHVDDWVCLASAGRDGCDGRTPNVCGEYDARKTYAQLDVVAFDGAGYIARKDDPRICPGPGWLPLSKQGKAGRKGETGQRGPRGEKGERGEPGRSFISWQLDRVNYRVSPLMSNGVGPMLELRGLFEQFLIDAGSV